MLLILMVLFSVSSDPCLAFPLHREVCPSLILVHARTRAHTHTHAATATLPEGRERKRGGKKKTTQAAHISNLQGGVVLKTLGQSLCLWHPAKILK